MQKLKQILKWLLPIAVSGGLLAYMLSSIDMSGVQDQITGKVIWIFGSALLVYGAVSLWLEARSVVLLVRSTDHSLTIWTAARIKSASYLLYILHYTLGAGALAVLLRRRANMTLSGAGGIVLLIVLFDMSVLVILSSVSAAFQSSDAAALRAGVITAAGFGIATGFAVLRTSRPLGPLERLRGLALFRAARTTELRVLAELAVLRLLFVMGFIGVGIAALEAFDVNVPLGMTVINITIVAIVATIPIAVAGIGTSQAAFLAVFDKWSDPGTLLACSLTFSAGLIGLRAAIGLVFSREFVKEAFQAARTEPEQA